MAGLTVDETIEMLQRISKEGHGTKRVCLNISDLDDFTWYAWLDGLYELDEGHGEIDLGTCHREDFQ